MAFSEYYNNKQKYFSSVVIMMSAFSLLYSSGVKLKTWGPNLACRVLKSGPWGGPGNIKAIQNGLHVAPVWPIFSLHILLQNSDGQKQLREAFMQPIFG